MKKIVSTFILISTIAFAQNSTKEENDKQLKSLNEKVYSLQSENTAIHKEISQLNVKLTGAILRLIELEKQIKDNNHALNTAKTELGTRIIETGRSSENKISAVDKSLNKNSLYGIIGVLSTILFSGLLYLFLSNRQKSDKSHVIEELSRTKASIEENLIKEFGKQTEFMITQIENEQKSKGQISTTIEPDHSLALKVASEINLIERNVALMDPKTKGIKQLLASVGKLKDNLNANGYEMPELLGKQFHQGMKVIVTNSILDETMDKNSEVITKVLIPQVIYNDKMIQTAQVEVTVGS